MFKKTALTSFIFSVISLLILMTPAATLAQGEVLGVHILNVHELPLVDQYSAQTRQANDDWQYVTVPFTLDDVHKQAEWQHFMQEAERSRLIPIVRLVTEVEDAAWKQPNRKEVTSMIDALAALDWPTEQRYIIIFNEVNHAKEWGGQLDPAGYARTFRFASQWAHATDERFIVLPAAMDLAAPNGSQTMEAFNYLNQMYAEDPEIFTYVDVWNSHSYPNPGFASSPTRTGQNSLRGFEYELAYLKEKTDRDYQVMITETGWVATPYTTRWLESYYTYALQHIWSDDRVIAVTPFLLKGDPGPFGAFSFFDRNDQPTAQFSAITKAVKNVSEDES